LSEAPAQRVVKRRDARAERATIVDGLLETLTNRAEIILSLCDRYARLEPADSEDRIPPTRRLLRERKRREQVDFAAG
jgi:hypothetical protein